MKQKIIFLVLTIYWVIQFGEVKHQDTHLDLSNTSKSYGYTTTDTKLNLKKSDKHSSLFRNYQMASYNVDIGNTSEDGSVAIPDSNKLHEVTEGIYRKMYELAPEDIGGWVTSFDGGWGSLWTGKESAHNSMYQGYDGGEWKTKECPPGYTRSARIHLKNGDDTDDIWGDGDDEIKLSGVTRICAEIEVIMMM